MPPKQLITSIRQRFRGNDESMNQRLRPCIRENKNTKITKICEPRKFNPMKVKVYTVSKPQGTSSKLICTVWGQHKVCFPMYIVSQCHYLAAYSFPLLRKSNQPPTQPCVGLGTGLINIVKIPHFKTN